MAGMRSVVFLAPAPDGTNEGSSPSCVICEDVRAFT
jgi:hypothetical protein